MSFLYQLHIQSFIVAVIYTLSELTYFHHMKTTFGFL